MTHDDKTPGESEALERLDLLRDLGSIGIPIVDTDSATEWHYAFMTDRWTSGCGMIEYKSSVAFLRYLESLPR